MHIIQYTKKAERIERKKGTKQMEKSAILSMILTFSGVLLAVVCNRAWF